jgi:release factor glutamine methyltransferase
MASRRIVLTAMNESPTTRPLTVNRALTAETARLRATSPTPRLDVEILLAHVLGTTRERLYAIPERQLTADERARLRALVGRRAQSEPVAYLTGRKAFRDIELELNEATLIPRPETETLVEVALEKLKELAGHALSVLDIGTGSGAVALAIAHEHPTVHVVGTDVQYRALEMARLNAGRLGLSARVEFLVSDLFDDLPPGGMFDVIVCNPPYIADGDLADTPPDVHRFEPHVALLGGAAGMDFYHRLVPAAPPFLRPGGWLALEIAEDKASEVRAVFEECHRYAPIEVHNDLGGGARVVAGRERS